MRNAVEKVAGAVERIDDEARLAFRAGNLAAFFHKETPIRTGIFQFAKNRILGAFHRLSMTKSAVPFRDLQVLDFAKSRRKLATRLAGSLFHDGHQAGKCWH